MGHKHTRKEHGQRAAQAERRGARQHAAATQPGSPGRRPVIIGVVLGTVALGGAALWGTRRDGAMRVAPAASTSAPVVVGLPPPAPGTRMPLNDTDPFTGKPIEPTSPTVTHKGYVIAFCCADSSGYKGGWARMSDSERDAVVRRYLKK